MKKLVALVLIALSSTAFAKSQCEAEGKMAYHIAEGKALGIKQQDLVGVMMITDDVSIHDVETGIKLAKIVYKNNDRPAEASMDGLANCLAR